MYKFCDICKIRRLTLASDLCTNALVWIWPVSRATLCPTQCHLRDQWDVCDPGLEQAGGHGRPEGCHLQRGVQALLAGAAAVWALPRHGALPAPGHGPPQRHGHCGRPAGTHQLHLWDRGAEWSILAGFDPPPVCCCHHNDQPSRWGF